MKKYVISLLFIAFSVASALAQEDSIFSEKTLDGVTVTARSAGTRRLGGAVNGMKIGQGELIRAACCNLGESFTTNPSVDVNYSDAATGARQIKLLGLAGTYVQMLTGNLPAFRGAAAPFALGYVPGTWMSGISVSKGAASVRNGYESITGQIDIEYLKPEAEGNHINVNLYGDSNSRFEANADGNIHLTDELSTNLLIHYEDRWGDHDGNGDGFRDMPSVRQYNIGNHWLLTSGKYIMHAGLSGLKENRSSGQVSHALTHSDQPLYNIGIETDRYEGYMKHAFILNPEKQMSVALMGNVSMHTQDALYGKRHYYVNEKNAYGQMLFDAAFTEHHSLAAGLSINYDYLHQSAENIGTDIGNERETTTGAYAQYTYSLGHDLTLMAGLRVDHSSLWGTFWTPRAHIRYELFEGFTLRASAGKGYRTVHALAENHNLLASSRIMQIDNLAQEEAENYGISAALVLPLGQHTLKINADYYYTRFLNQAVIDMDSDPQAVHIENLTGKSHSHVFQIDASYPFFKGFELTAAWRFSDVKSTYCGEVREKPLTSRYKGLLTASYKTPLGLWQFDATLQLNGGGRMPDPYTLADGSPSWNPTFHSYEQLSAQVTREFRHFSVYVGGENLTSFKQKNPIIGASEPWGNRFDTTMVWGPIDGAMVYAGIRVKL